MSEWDYWLDFLEPGYEDEQHEAETLNGEAQEDDGEQCACCYNFVADAPPPYCQDCHDEGCP